MEKCLLLQYKTIALFDIFLEKKKKLQTKERRGAFAQSHTRVSQEYKDSFVVLVDFINYKGKRKGRLNTCRHDTQ